MALEDPWKAHRTALGAYIRSQRKLAQLSLREMAELADVSNPYLSQVERGLHEPSLRVLHAIARALNISAETLLAQAGLLEARREPSPDSSQHDQHDDDRGGTEAAIRADPALTDAQKEALLAVYRSFVPKAS